MSQSVNFDTTENLIIEGDNLEVLNRPRWPLSHDSWHPWRR